MRACKNLIRAKKNRYEEQKARIYNLEKELMCMYEKMRELEHRVIQLEIH